MQYQFSTALKHKTEKTGNVFMAKCMFLVAYCSSFLSLYYIVKCLKMVAMVILLF